MSPLQDFNPFDAPYPAERQRAKQLCEQLNAIAPQKMKARKVLMRELFGSVGNAYLEPLFVCDYGYNIHLGERFYANHHCVMLDAAEIRIGARVLFGPSVHIYTTTHPLDVQKRATGMQQVAPVTIGDDCWLGGQVIVMPGVSIGAGSVVGTGSIVTRDIPPGVVAAGNPCRILRPC